MEILKGWRAVSLHVTRTFKKIDSRNILETVIQNEKRTEFRMKPLALPLG
jgi:hypothetical protein